MLSGTKYDRFKIWKVQINRKGTEMRRELIFDGTQYVVETVEIEGKTLTYRAFENIFYCKKPVDEEIQRLSIFVPEVFYRGEAINGWHMKNAPIFLPNTIGGYMPGVQERPGKTGDGHTNAAFYALLHGCVVVSPGTRGRGLKNAQGEFIGAAPAALCDLKAVVRYLKANEGRIPGDVNRIISNGTSAGGAMSALLGTTGNHPDFSLYLEEMGAAETSDVIFASSCYCPITNLDHADAAYEWEFYGLNDFYGRRMVPPEKEGEMPEWISVEGVMTKEQQELSMLLKNAFPAYVNALQLKDREGTQLTLDEQGEGSFVEYIKSYVAASAEKELERGVDLSGLDWLEAAGSRVTGIDFRKYVWFRTRMKETPAFDNVELGAPENELFGTKQIQCRHFTEFGLQHSAVEGQLADIQQIRMMNPMNYIEDKKAGKAEHFRIRHGSVDRDTSLAISAMLAAKLTEAGIDTDLFYPWGVYHAGDYDPEELFMWIDTICKQ